MRTRFLLILLLVLASTVTAVSAVHIYFFKQERMYLIDRQIEQTAALLISSSDFTQRRVEDHEETDDYLAELLGRTAINTVILLRDSDGYVLYANENAELLDTSLSTRERWSLVETERHEVKVLTLPIDKGSRILQVGLVLNQNFLRWKRINQRVLIYMVLILIGVFLVSLFLRRLLLAPLDRLARYLTRISTHLGSATLELSSSPDEELKDMENLSASDEFSRLIAATRELSRKIRADYRSTQRWTAQMVHEIKTPLAIIQSQIEIARGPGANTHPALLEASQEIDHLGEMIDEFLDWSLSQTRVGLPADLHALKLGKTVGRVVESLDRLYPGRLRMTGSSDQTVFARPSHLDQLLANLITNALKYSPTSSKVEVRIEDDQVVIRDEGPGIPPEVIAHRGQPFLRGVRENERQTSGFGLGLAWVTTLTSQYDWPIKFESGSQGTTVTLIFPTAPEPA